MDKYALSLMNLCGTAVLLCAGLSRFIYPLISLEGRKFWILGLMPVSRGQILQRKPHSRPPARCSSPGT
ncbi:MAG: hypothetical protein U0791_15385 [Gemmataceae bacterium]